MSICVVWFSQAVVSQYNCCRFQISVVILIIVANAHVCISCSCSRVQVIFLNQTGVMKSMLESLQNCRGWLFHAIFCLFIHVILCFFTVFSLTYVQQAVWCIFWIMPRNMLPRSFWALFEFLWFKTRKSGLRYDMHLV